MCQHNIFLHFEKKLGMQLVWQPKTTRLGEWPPNRTVLIPSHLSEKIVTVDYIWRFTNNRTPVKESWPWINSKGKKTQGKALRVLRRERKGHLSDQVLLSEFPRQPPVWPGALKHDIWRSVIGECWIARYIGPLANFVRSLELETSI